MGSKVKKESVFTYAQLQEMQAWPLEMKIENAQKIIRQTFKYGKKIALAFSGGKDSTALWHLIRETCPEEAKNMIVIFGNTGVEYKESLDFARKLGKEWGGENFHETKLDRIKVPRLKYEAQKMVWAMIEKQGDAHRYLNKKGRLLSTDKLNEAVTPKMWELFREQNLVWEAGTQISFWFIAEQYGFPILGKDATKLDAPRININVFLKYSTEQSEGNKEYYDMLREFPDMRISHSCCYFIKEQPSQKLQKKLGCDTLFRGLLASESRRRTFTFLDYGFLYKGADKYLYSSPLAIFTDTDIWAYINSRNCPYSELYDLTDEKGNKLFERNGCYTCGTGLAYEGNNIEILRKHYQPKWRGLMKYGMAREMKTFACAMCNDVKLNALESDYLLDNRPCAFDRLTPKTDILKALREEPEQLDLFGGSTFISNISK
ncbi:phosphoadenosine phosphosulfate reductase family protein [Ruminiclostridium sufflavum DSM 19573]|uniref:Phosphoadenosine phosphosulfate reductase family protein n=1 Tax=Ruminiclostridium sufflavum DSM 19573 TaxID=1121337 RepID=A0A318XLG7_9FIRM|nr:phosphoadenosine phosphosulfate reductase family protein [Ruminiclostridium sufflavum]PYG88473.1 phosphoadenosine phosphosulfate reductase family protein [Ruminiclostridium sufflavum DSM 19573]